MKMYTDHKSYTLAGLAIVFYVALLGIFTLMPSASPFESNEVDVRPVHKFTAIDTDLSIISKWHLFGKNDLEKFNNNNIKLIGIIFQDNASKAIMLVNSEERIFKSGDKINSIYSVQKIEPSRVVITTTEGPQQLGLFEAMDSENQTINEVNGLPAPAADISNNNQSQDYNINSENNQLAQDQESQVVEQPQIDESSNENQVMENLNQTNVYKNMRRSRNE